MLASYNFKIYHHKGKKNPVNLSFYRPDYIIKNDVKEEKKNPLKNLILRKVRFKDFLTANYSKKEESQSMRLLIRAAVKVAIRVLNGPKNMVFTV